MIKKILLIILILYCSNAYSQVNKSEFQNWWDKGQTYLQKGDYFRAKNIFDYCSKLWHPKSKEANVMSKNIISIIKLKNEMIALINKGNFSDSKNIAYKILEKNPNDQIAINIINDKIEKGQKISIIVDNSSKSKIKPSISISSPKIEPKINKPINQIGQKQKSITNDKSIKNNIKISDEEIALIEAEEIAKKLNQEINNLYLKAISNYNNCQFSGSQKEFTKLLKLKSNARTSSKISRIIDNIIAYRNDISSFSTNSNNYNDVQKSYEKLLIKFSEVNKIDKRFLPCPQYKTKYDDFVYNHILDRFNGNNCSDVISYLVLLKNNNIEKYNSTVIQKIINECEKDTNSLNNCNTKKIELNAMFNEAKSSFSDGNCSDAKIKLAEVIKFKINIPSTCKTNFDQNKISDLQSEISNCLKNKECEKLQLSRIEEIYALSEKGNCIEANIKAEKIKKDSMCLDFRTWKSFKIELSRINKCANNELMHIFEDSAKRALNANFLKDCKNLSNFALVYSQNNADSIRIKNLYFYCDCRQKSKRPEDCAEKTEICDSIKISSNSIYFGASFTELRSKSLGEKSYNYPTISIGYRFDNLIVKKIFSLGYFLEFSRGFPLDYRYNQISLGGLLNFTTKRPECNNKKVVFISLALSPTYLFEFLKTDKISTQNFGLTSLENQLLWKIEPTINIRSKKLLFNIGYFEALDFKNKDINNSGFNFKLGRVF